MASPSDDYGNITIINSETMAAGDFQILLDCLAEIDRVQKVTAEKRATQRARQSKNTLRKFQSQPQISQSQIIEAWNPNQTVIGSTFEANVADAPLRSANASFNDTFGSEQLQGLFAYFDQEVSTPAQLLYSDDSLDELDNDDDRDGGRDDSSVESGVAQSPVDYIDSVIEDDVDDHVPVLLLEKSPTIPSSKPFITAAMKKPLPPKHSKPRQIDTGKRHSNDILKIITQFNGIGLNNENKKDSNEIKKKEFKYTVDVHNNTRPVDMKTVDDSDRMSTYSGSSTVVVSDSESDSIGGMPFDMIDCGNVKRKVALFNDHSNSERSSSATQSINSVLSDDDDARCKFRENREYFEKFFKGQQTTMAEKETAKPTHEQIKPMLQRSQPIAVPNAQRASDSIDPYERLEAIQTYVQTKYFVGRIQRVALAFSRCNENRMSTMNLMRLHKFLVFIRDCTLMCNDICNDIGTRILTDMERNDMSAEELLFSALKSAYTYQVTIRSPAQECAVLDISEGTFSYFGTFEIDHCLHFLQYFLLTFRILTIESN